MYAGGLEVVYRDERGINTESQPTYSESITAAHLLSQLLCLCPSERGSLDTRRRGDPAPALGQSDCQKHHLLRIPSECCLQSHRSDR
jgi:hypothetical protein